MISMDDPLLWLSEHDPYTLRDVCDGGVCVFGQTGSGKTSGSGKALAKSLLSRGAGFLVCCAKGNEADLWEKLAGETGRSESVLRFTLDGSTRFNFVSWAADHYRRRGLRPTQNLVELITTLAKAVRRNGSDTGGGDEGPFWDKAFSRTLSKAIDLVEISTGDVTLSAISEVVNSAPLESNQLLDEHWKANSLCSRLVEASHARLESLAEDDRNDFDKAARYFYSEWARLADKTRSIILSIFNEVMDLFLSGPLRRPFCTDSNFVPELTHHGAIVLLDMPVLQLNEVGLAAQMVLKYCFQKSVERSSDRGHDDTIPAVLWCDEAQYFIDPEVDMRFLSTSRAARAPTIYMSQSKSAFDGEAGEKAKAKIDAVLANLGTKIFHSQSDHPTREWAANLFGKEVQLRMNTSEGTNSMGSMPAWVPGGENENIGFSEQIDFAIQPAEFSTLRTGGPTNDCRVEAIVYKAGRTWKASQKTSLRCSFDQRI